MAKSSLLFATSKALATIMVLCAFDSVIGPGENQSYFNPGTAEQSPGGVQIPQMPSPYIQGSMEYINHHRELQNWHLISYVYWTIPGETVYAPTIVPMFPTLFNAETMASHVYGALAGTTQGKGSDLPFRIIGTRYFTSISSDQRKLVAEKITSVIENKKKKISLNKLLVDKYTGHSEEFMLAIAEEPQILDAKHLNDAITGKKDRKDLNEFATTRSNRQLAELQRVYPSVYTSKQLHKDIISGTNLKLGKMFRMKSSTKEENPYQELVLKIFRGERDENNLYEHKQTTSNNPVPYYQPNLTKVEEDVGRLLGTKLSQVYSNILGERSYAHIRKIMENLSAKSKTLEELIMTHFDGDYKELLLTICEVATDMPKYFAVRFYKAMHSGVTSSLANGGLDDNDFIRYLTSRSQVDLKAITEAYRITYKRTLLQDALKEREILRNPEYKDGVIGLLIGNDPTTGYEKGGYEQHTAIPK